MNMKYDSKVNAIYIELSKGKYNKSRKMNDSIMVNEDKNGKVLGIEIWMQRKIFKHLSQKIFLFKPPNLL